MKANLLEGWKGVASMVSISLALMGCVDQTSGTDSQNSAEELAEDRAPVPAAVSEEEIPPARAVIPPADLSPGISEVVKLAQSGVGDEVVLAYINKSGGGFNPTVDEIVYLKDLGLSESVLASLLNHKNAQAGTVSPASENKILPPPAPSALPTQTVATTPSYSVAAAPDYTEAVTAPAAPQQININYFESNLSPYGSWVDVADYGRCWQPTVVLVNRGWRPYSDRGRWIYSSAGWYWQSDYSWGWAAFHYGRWHCDNRIGWVWVPGSTWGPAWVSWRYTDDYCGWAPLPPTAHFDGFGFRYHGAHVGVGIDFGLRPEFYPFIPIRHLGDKHPQRYFVPPAQAKVIYQKSVVNNRYIRGNNNTVINEGIGRDRVARASGKPVPIVAFTDVPVSGNSIGRADRLEGNRLHVFRPNVSATATVHAPETSRHNSAALTATTRQNVSTESAPNSQLGTRPHRGLNSPSVKTGATPVSPVETRATRNSSVPTATARQNILAEPTQNSQPMTRTHRGNNSASVRADAVHASPPETTTPRTADPSAQQQSRGTFPRTWEQSFRATRNPSTSIPSTTTTPTVAPPSADTRSAVAQPIPSALRNFPPAQTPAAQTPSQRTEISIPRQTGVAPQSAIRSEGPARDQSIRREVDAATPRALRSTGTERPQPVFNAPENFRRGSQVERPAPMVVQPTAPQSPSPAPRAVAPRVAAPEVSSPRNQAASAPRIDHSDRSSRDKNKN